MRNVEGGRKGGQPEREEQSDNENGRAIMKS